MKIFDVDVSVRYIVFKMQGHKYCIQFRENKRNGIYDIEVCRDGEEQKIEIELTYPPLKYIISELWRIHRKLWIRQKIKLFLRRYNQ